MAERENIETKLGQRGYSIQYIRDSAGTWRCSICHDSWWTDNPYASRSLPTGRGDSQIGALVAAMIDGNLKAEEETEA